MKHIPELVKGLIEGYDIVICSRTMKASEVEKSLKRQVISFCYNFFVKSLFSLDLKDLQCGFKAINKRTLNEIVKQTKHLSEGFMDTEMLILSVNKGFKTKEIPVKWKDDRESKFSITRVTLSFLKNILKVKRDLILGRYK